ncbi:MAG: pseudouridine synthase [Pseudomonadales bacterium]|nr:pseudouridine synthase [Pseudomonadales bacterium]
MARLILLNKPYGTVSQFSENRDGHPTLKNLVPIKGIYPAGRLDRDSEGLLLLTDDGQLQHRISAPEKKLPKTYWAQLEGNISEQALVALRQGVQLRDGLTRPAKVKLITAPDIPDRDPPIRFRKNDTTSWIELTILEGKNRQVRRMTAAVGYPTLRLIRVKVGVWTLDNLKPGEWREIVVNLPVKQGSSSGTKYPRSHPGKNH